LSSSSRFSGLACRYAIKVHPGFTLSSQIKAAALIATWAPRRRFETVTIAVQYYSGNFADSASVPDPRGGMKLAANAKALMGTFVPSGAMP
jgi:hypothetical protein